MQVAWTVAAHEQLNIYLNIFLTSEMHFSGKRQMQGAMKESIFGEEPNNGLL
jgi:hypothetical protein